MKGDLTPGGRNGWGREDVLVATVALGAVLAPLNSTMIAVALPAIADELAAGPAAAGWLVTAYLIAMASLQPVAGRLGDRLGRRRLILWGLAGFGLASLAATLAPNLPLLIVLRVAQAVSGAVVLPNGDALLREIVPDERRAGRFGLIGSAIGLAAAVGPLVGGALVSTTGWRAMFAINLLLVVPENGEGFVVPFTKAFVPVVDVKHGRVVLVTEHRLSATLLGIETFPLGFVIEVGQFAGQRIAQMTSRHPPQGRVIKLVNCPKFGD